MRHGADGGHEAERDRQIVVAAFLGQVGGGEVDGDAACRQSEPGGDQRRAYPLPGFRHRFVGQADDVDIVKLLNLLYLDGHDNTRPKAFSYIRMSTDGQLKGDSLRRQMDELAKYAAANDLELVEDLRDIGIAAFKGANVADGALGRFLKAAGDGKVPRGSYRLVESLDRISRQEIPKSLSLFLQIIQADITIVTLTDRRVFNQDKCELEDLMMRCS